MSCMCVCVRVCVCARVCVQVCMCACVYAYSVHLSRYLSIPSLLASWFALSCGDVHPPFALATPGVETCKNVRIYMLTAGRINGRVNRSVVYQTKTKKWNWSSWSYEREENEELQEIGGAAAGAVSSPAMAVLVFMDVVAVSAGAVQRPSL